jgi:hypothetical protein
VAGYRKGSERAEIAAIFEGDQAKRNDNQEYSFLVNMPAEEEGCVAAKSERSDEGIPIGLEP